MAETRRGLPVHSRPLRLQLCGQGGCFGHHGLRPRVRVDAEDPDAGSRQKSPRDRIQLNPGDVIAPPELALDECWPREDASWVLAPSQNPCTFSSRNARGRTRRRYAMVSVKQRYRGCSCGGTSRMQACRCRLHGWQGKPPANMSGRSSGPAAHSPGQVLHTTRAPRGRPMLLTQS